MAKTDIHVWMPQDGEWRAYLMNVDRQRVVVTGLGPLTPIGIGVDEFWNSLIGGQSGVAPIEDFDCRDLPCRFAGCVPRFSPKEYMDNRRTVRLERFSQLAIAAAQLAWADAGLAGFTAELSRVAVSIGTSIGGLGSIAKQLSVMEERGVRSVNPLTAAALMPNAAAAEIAAHFEITGPSECVATACAASGHAIARGIDYIRSGAVDIVLAGGAEATVNRFALAAFSAAGALSTRNSDPASASRPFDVGRDGFVLSEGATVLVLEGLDHALSRSAPIRAELRGYGLSSDPHSMVAPNPNGLGAALSMRRALNNARLDGANIGYINAHATSTRLGDLAESRGIVAVFGLPAPPVSATKSLTGHMLGASGAAEAAATILAMQHHTLPPTINVEKQDEDCTLDIVSNAARSVPAAQAAISNSFGFGGHNVSLVVAAVDGL